MSIKLENTEVVGWEHAIRGMRNPKNSWSLSDTNFHARRDVRYCDDDVVCFVDEDGSEFMMDGVEIGPNDHKLMMSLAKGGPVHAKYRRMIVVYVDITAPLYWWKEADTYRFGVEKNSCSTMHKIHDKEFDASDFSIEHLIDHADICKDDFVGDGIYQYHTPYEVMNLVIETLNRARNKYLEAKTKPMKDESKRAWLMKHYWWQMIQLLPSTYNQKRTVMLNYEVLNNIYHSRKNHKLDEWHTLCDWIRNLPYSEIITGEQETD